MAPVSAVRKISALTVEFTVIGIPCLGLNGGPGITPRTLTDAITGPDRAAAKRAFEAMMTMVKIDVAAIEAARKELTALRPRTRRGIWNGGSVDGVCFFGS